MKIYYDCETLSNLENSFLFLDTSSLIAVTTYENLFNNFLTEIGKVNCEMATIPSVLFELSRTESIDTYNKRMKFIKNYVNIYPIERHYDQYEELIPILHKIKGKISYTDFLLYCCLYQFSKSFLLTENHADFSTAILNRLLIITIDKGDQEIRNSAIYTFSKEKFEKAAAGILRGVK
ncbi:MAG: hypothetical protein Q7K55_02790 [Candidatus Levybacteria bacterium]|nr:hypothetical protein [Candidatus Levybacteria bacterium]